MNDDSDEIQSELKSDEKPSEVKGKPRNVSSSLWERFKTISERTDEVTKRSTDRRIQKLRKSVLDKVNDELKTPEERDILQKHSVVLGPSIDVTCTKDEYGKDDGNSQSKSLDNYNEVNKYMGINDHLVNADWTRQYTKSGLEKQIDQAVTTGDITKAEQLSDKLATRNYGVRVAEAFQAQEHLKRKKEEEETAKARKKKKLAWGFEQKHRWETKGNM